MHMSDMKQWFVPAAMCRIQFSFLSSGVRLWRGVRACRYTQGCELQNSFLECLRASTFGVEHLDTLRLRAIYRQVEGAGPDVEEAALQLLQLLRTVQRTLLTDLKTSQ